MKSSVLACNILLLSSVQIVSSLAPRSVIDSTNPSEFSAIGRRSSSSDPLGTFGTPGPYVESLKLDPFIAAIYEDLLLSRDLDQAFPVFNVDRNNMIKQNIGFYFNMQNFQVKTNQKLSDTSGKSKKPFIADFILNGTGLPDDPKAIMTVKTLNYGPSTSRYFGSLSEAVGNYTITKTRTDYPDYKVFVVGIAGPAAIRHAYPDTDGSGLGFDMTKLEAAHPAFQHKAVVDSEKSTELTAVLSFQQVDQAIPSPAATPK